MMNADTGQTLSNSASVTGGGDIKVTCPRCGEFRGSRVKRRGFVQKQIMPFFGYFPWQCGSCRFEWNSKIRGEKRRRRVGKEPKAFVEPTIGFIESHPTSQPTAAAQYEDDTQDDVE